MLDVFFELFVVLIVFLKGIFINENLILFRWELLKEVNKKCKNNIILSVWIIDGKVFVKIFLVSRLIRIYDKNDLEDF